jgi:transcription-repair coupling factor (superfamily II helicase)
MIKLKSIISNIAEFESLRERIFQNKTVSIKGVSGSFQSFVLNYIYELFENTLLVVVPDTEFAEKLADDLQSLSPPDRVHYFPQAETLPFDQGTFAPAINSTRLKTLISLLENPTSIVITTPIGLIQHIEPPEAVRKQLSYLKVGDSIDREFLIEWLVETGYERLPAIEEIGQFSVRGGIIDIFSFEADAPFRIELNEDIIESIREFDILSQLSIRKAEKIRLSGKSSENTKSATLFEYLKPGSLIYWDDVERSRILIRDWFEQAERIYKENEEIEIPPSSFYVTDKNLKTYAQEFRQIYHLHFKTKDMNVIDFNTQRSQSFQGNFKLFIKYLDKRFGRNQKQPVPVFIVYDTPQRRERLEEIILAEMGWLPPFRFIQGDIHSGFYLPNHPMEVLTEHEIFDRVKARKNRRKLKVSGSIIRQLNSLKPGDYVVHIDYGIGKYIGTERIKVANLEKETIKIEYDNRDILYVNLDKLNHVQKYVSEEGYHPQLTRLGSADWERIKDKTKKAVENIARDLVTLYATRMSTTATPFSPDSLWQKELEASFLYVDTPDQARTTQEVKDDMERNKPMDRLICGDVGFGKTEVAIRAAFKSIMDDKQSAFLVPTTILAQQHFHTLRDRLRNFPMNIEVISRFRSRAEQLKILQRLESGDVDIIIGTHRLLSQDVKFKDLGLLIIDEEQQFGVKHKEQLRKLKTNVDTLTLSATPIPRTLQMSLMGARDLSNIDTPPQNRLPIITEICTWDRELIYRAITYEIGRGGQVFFVHNRVQTITGVAEMLRQIVPKAKIGIAHGQMRERDLEKVMGDFYGEKFDVLLATMIIENGLDIPNCNTIIINRADQFGLAQLYQLRGRVGRSDRQAYAYLIVPPHDRLTDTAIKRLYAIEEFTDLGSGLKIALRDLEIRGAGNMLGHQQSGYINAVGYDLYQKILQDSVHQIQEETLPPDLIQKRSPQVDATIEADAEMYIPENYIEAGNEKVLIYHRLLNLESMISIENLAKELRDRFGPMPSEVINLIEMVKIKKLASQRFIKQVKIFKNKMSLTFDTEITEKDSFIESELPRYINQEMAPLTFSQTEGFKVYVELKGKNNLDYLSFAKNFLQNL